MHLTSLDWQEGRKKCKSEFSECISRQVGIYYDGFILVVARNLKISTKILAWSVTLHTYTVHMKDNQNILMLIMMVFTHFYILTHLHQFSCFHCRAVHYSAKHHKTREITTDSNPMLVLHFFICFLGSHTTFHLSSLPQQWAWKPGMDGLQKSPKLVLVSIFF